MLSMHREVDRIGLPKGRGMRIVRASISDLEDVLFVERAAFGRDDEAELVRSLLMDTSAEPYESLLARDGERPVGHILFTAARLEGASRSASVTILAPLAVVPDAQGRGVGGLLIEEGLRILTESRVDLVFVGGHPDYYPRHGFVPAEPQGFAPPYPIPPEHEEAWMVRELVPGLIGSLHGRVLCADSLDRPEYWRE